MLKEYPQKDTIISNISNVKITEKNENDLSDKNEISSLIIVEPSKFIASLDLRGIWEYRELLYFLSLRDIKIRYKQTLLGIGWVLLQPIIITIIFTTVFQSLGTNQNLAVPYPLFAFSGFMLWSFMSSAIMNCSGSLINHTTLITKVYFPRLVIPISAVGATLIDLVFGLVSLFIAMLIYGVAPSWRMLLIILPIIPTLFLSLGIGIFTAALNVRFRDVKYILPLFIQILFFISPIFYSLSMLSENSIWIWKLNPVAGILENFRALLFGLPFDWLSFIIATLMSIAIFILSIFVFHRMEDDFADII